MKAYYARPINLYGTPQDARDIKTLETLGFEVVNPDKEELQKLYAKVGMNVYLDVVNYCDLVAFRSFPDGKISAGVAKEVEQALTTGKPVLELPTITEQRVLSVNDTRSYLSYLGNR